LSSEPASGAAGRTPIRRALLSVADKRGIVEFARALVARGVALLSTGGTAQLLGAAGLAVTEVSAYTGFPEIMDGRVKTLHPRVHGGLLGRRGVDEEVMRAHGIEPIDLLVVNLYPFAATVARPDASYADGVENIDVGGPAMLRAAAKNHAAVTVLVDPADYAAVLAALEAGGTDFALRQRLAARALAHTARYDTLVADWLARQAGPATSYPESLELRFVKRLDLRYGENPHQSGAFYADPGARGSSVASARQV
jgi:phosphoribosylaminoimidazolecarboxamide formyltransferase / IMP cyclohydrolase